jgi:transglutaminase/protease-like cytokinesis protein 3
MKKYIKMSSSSFKKKASAYEKKVMKKIYKGTALCIGTNWHDADRAAVAMAYRKGSCSFLTPMFNVLCNGAGVEAYILDGEYVNRDGSRAYHNWSFVKMNGKYYWFDVPVACKNKTAKSSWYKKGTKYWKTCHAWSSSSLKGFDKSKFAK